MKKILKCVGSIALAVCIALGCFFIPKNLSKNQRFLGTSLDNASASTNPPSILPPDITLPLDLYFSGSDFFTGFVPYRTSSTLVTNFSDYLYSGGGNLASGLDFFNMRFGFSIGVDNFYLQYTAVRNLNNYICNNNNFPNSISVPASIIELSDFSFASLENSFIANSIFRKSIVTPMQNYKTTSGSYYVNFGFEIYKDNTNLSEFVKPTLDMVSFELLNSYQFASKFGYDSAFTNSNIIRYVDTAGYSYIVYIPNVVDASVSQNIPWHYYYLTYRKYLLPSYFNLSDNSVYQQGVSDGYAEGVLDGNSQGYDRGFNAGNTEGFNEGYIEGLNTANEFTFNSLIGAVFDAPLNAFISLFNFNFLGVNLLSFVTSILTFAVVVFVIKKLFGGK